ncbi:hypothetical protein COS75_00855, partial [Candidatus Pacearchaeota archaeon CG06_land_8_20_14_3_00_35_12]
KDVDADGCLELGEIIACGTNEKCENDACVAKCVDACVLGTKTCSANNINECVLGSEGCSIWRTTSCETGKKCINGVCVPEECVPEWICGAWSECVDGIAGTKTRTCEEKCSKATKIETAACADVKEFIEEQIPTPEPFIAPLSDEVREIYVTSRTTSGGRIYTISDAKTGQEVAQIDIDYKKLTADLSMKVLPSVGLPSIEMPKAGIKMTAYLIFAILAISVLIVYIAGLWKFLPKAKILKKKNK